MGIKNTINQENLIKNNINLPIKKILSFLENENPECNTKYLFTHNLNIKFYVKDKKDFVINPKNIVNKNYNCSFIIKTFIGNDNLEVNFINKHFKIAKPKLNLKNIKYDKFSYIKENYSKIKLQINLL